MELSEVPPPLLIMLRMLLDKIMKRVNVPMPMLLKKGKLNLCLEMGGQNREMLMQKGG